MVLLSRSEGLPSVVGSLYYNIVEYFNKPKSPMATINVSVPDEVKKEFNTLFAKENKSAIITGLMRRAIEERKLRERRAATIEALLHLRSRQPPVSDDEIAESRQAIRP